ncbi:cytochrome c oxidase subunit I [Phycisphaerales bacterium AB-hyl4]|uniref:cytochrome-c oxidase n=1 Tax=Natronomicrosphaera hydrolytica TaxID=3242702 RepID=A0ABV4U3F7_9BACT
MLDHADNFAAFQRTWASPRSFPRALAEVNNQPLGKRFMLTAFIFFLLGGVLALLMRIQLAVPDNDFLGPQVYNQLFTMHGSTMMYLFAVPFLEGLAIYLLPLMVGSRDMVFPRLTAFSYWVYLFGGIIFYASFVTGHVPDAGWFAYTPLSGPEYAGIRQDYWLLGLAMVEIAGIATAIEIVVTILKCRAPGMTLARMPLFAWAMLIVGLMIIFAFTTLLMATVLLELDRAFGTHFFNPSLGGHTLLWQHLFWFFGHPEVYIMFLPATGIISMVAAAAAGRLVGYTLITVAILVTGFMSFGLWVHHMYTTGLPELAMHFFAAASLMIATASGVQVFAWIATLWGTRPRLTTPVLYLLGFLFLFVLGGFTGVMIAVVPFDWQVHDTYFLVAHFHYVLIGGVVFPVFAGLHFWLPKITGRMLGERLGALSFWLSFVGFNATFFPMHILGFFGLPRRVYTYPELIDPEGQNLFVSAGAFVFAAGTLVFLINFALSLRWGDKAADNPWGSDTLEWSLPSPPPVYAFERPAIVHGRHPLWGGQRRGGTAPDPQPDTPALQASHRAADALHARPTTWRATLITDALHARPQAIQWLPGLTYKPLLASLGLLVAMVATLYQYYLVLPLGLAYSLLMVGSWLWPGERRLARVRDDDVGPDAGMTVFPSGSASPAWWGVVGLLAVLGMVFAVLVYAYYYLWLFSDAWPQHDLPRPGVLIPAIALIVLACSSVPVAWASRQLARGEWRPTFYGLIVAALPGTLFLAWQAYEIYSVPFLPQTNAYGSIFHVTHYALAITLATAIVLNIAMIARLHHDPQHHGHTQLQMQITAMLWHFTVVAAAVVFAVLYVSPWVL